MSFLKKLAVAAAISLSATSVSAATVSAEYVPSTAGGSNPAGRFTAQTFLATVSGVVSEVAAHIVNYAGSVEDVTVALYSTSGGVPSSSLGSVTLPYTAFPTNASLVGASNFTGFDFSLQNINLVAGTSYAMVVTTTETLNKYSFRASVNQTDQYDNGQRYTSTNGTTWYTPASDWDYGFRVTVSETATPPVPLPASLPLLLVAFGGVGLMRTRRSA